MIQLIYMSLLILMTLALYYSGRKITTTDSEDSILKAGIVGIIAYTLNEGLRWGRGIDYNLYYYGYNDIGKGLETNWEPAYQLICKLFYSIGLPWQFMVAFMSFVLICSVCFFLRNFREVAHYALPLFGLLALQAETLMRWYLAFSFIFIALSLYLKEEKSKREYIYILLLCIIRCSIHNAIFFIIPILWLISKVKSPLVSPITAIVLYYGLGQLFSINFMNNFVHFFNMYSLGARYEDYSVNADYWLSRGYLVGEANAFMDLKYSAFWIMIVWFGHKICKISDQKYTFVYNSFLIGFIFNPVYHQIELLNRYGSLLLLFQFVVLAHILKKYFENSYNNLYFRLNYLARIIIIVLSLNFSRSIFLYPFADKEDHYLYVWDANGRETLDVTSYWE